MSKLMTRVQVKVNRSVNIGRLLFSWGVSDYAAGFQLAILPQIGAMKNGYDADVLKVGLWPFYFDMGWEAT